MRRRCSAAAGRGDAPAAADAPPLILEHLTTADGLPQGTVYVTLQDSQGFVWLATEDGLIRYDGHELLRYAYSPQQPAAACRATSSTHIVEDAHHDLWIAIKDGGLARWNRATDTLHASIATIRPIPTRLASDAVHAVLVDARGRVWVGTSNAGVDILEPATGRFEHLRHDAQRPRTRCVDDRITTLALDHAGDAVGRHRGRPGSLAARAPCVQRICSHAAADAHSLSGERISRVLEDRSGALVGRHLRWRA